MTEATRAPGPATIEIFTDGACRGNPGPGGWGALLRAGAHERELWGGEPETTNNRMEMTAVVQALRALKRPSEVVLTTDSQYVRKGITEWIDNWKRRGWQTSQKKPVKNAELWREIDEAAASHRIEWRWVKGHSGHAENERVDALANRGIDELGGAPLVSRQIVLDTETTGLDPKSGHRVIEVGCVEMRERRLSGNNLHLYLQPDREVDPAALEVHGITDEFLLDKPRFTDVIDELRDYLVGAELIIHNADFDVGFLEHEFALAGQPLALAELCTVTDTLRMARKQFPGQRNSLDALCKRLGVSNGHRTLHGALLDSEILADVYLAMTGGQTALVLDEEGGGGDASGGGVASVDTSRLRLVRASGAELVAHEAWMERLEAEAGEGCVWRRFERSPDGDGADAERPD